MSVGRPTSGFRYIFSPFFLVLSSNAGCAVTSKLIQLGTTTISQLLPTHPMVTERFLPHAGVIDPRFVFAQLAKQQNIPPHHPQPPYCKFYRVHMMTVSKLFHFKASYQQQTVVLAESSVSGHLVMKRTKYLKNQTKQTNIFLKFGPLVQNNVNSNPHNGTAY